LLGFGLENATPDQVELRALEQMEKLRPHQLVQPDLVTEGMNRLAQALIALTATASSGPEVPADPHIATVTKPKRHRPGGRHARPSGRTATEEVFAAEPVLEAEPLVTGPVPPLTPGRFLPPEQPRREPILADELPVRLSEQVLLPLGPAADPTDHRKTYAKLVLLRRLRRGLDGLRPFFGDPGEQLLTPIRVFEYVRTVRDFRREFSRVSGNDWPVRHGRSVLRVVNHPLGLAVFRAFIPSQRAAMAADWALAVEELEEAYRSLRAAVRESSSRRALAAGVRAARMWMRENPEWAIGLAIGVALVIAIIRSAARTATAT
jgi:hypothetical protein